MARWTQRQQAVALAWMEEQWNRPSRTDVYLMLVAHEARYAFAKNKRAFNSKEYTLPFHFVEKPVRPAGSVKDAAAAISKSRWLGAMTAPVKVVEVTPEEAKEWQQE